MATVLYADGTSAALPAPERGLSPETIRKVIGGWMEIVRVGDTEAGWRVLILDEEGKLKGKPLNRKATALYQTSDGLRHPGDVIVGDVILAEVIHPGEDDERVR